MVSVEQANGVLAQIQDAGSGRAVTELSWIDQIRVEGSRVVFRLALPGFAQGQRERIAGEARQALLSLDGIDDVQIELGQPPARGESARPAMDNLQSVSPSQASAR